MALSNAQRAKRYRKRLKEKAARLKASSDDALNEWGCKRAFWTDRPKKDFDQLLAWNEWEFTEALDGVATRQEVHDMAEDLTFRGVMVEFKSLEERQAFRALHASMKSERARRLAEHEQWRAEQRAQWNETGPRYVDDEVLARVLGMPDHPDHPSRREQVGAWDSGLPDDENVDGNDES
jgi:hypothetical protein